MKNLILFLLLVQSISASGQDFPNLSDLSENLIDKNRNDSLNLVAIFNWITDNIAYDNDDYLVSNYYPDFKIDRYLDSAQYMNIYNRKVSELVLTKKKAICDGYSRLFLTLCEFADIRCQYISGEVRDPLSDDLIGHAWNAVYIDGKWRLIDLTWASGGISGSTYVKEKNMFFYFTPPEQLIFDHIPDDLKWSLLDSMTVHKLLNESPILSYQPFENGLTDCFPKNKSLKVDTLNPIKISLVFDRKIEIEDIHLSGSPTESLIDQMDIEVTGENFDSLLNAKPNLFLVIPKIEVSRKEIAGRRYEFTVQALTSKLKEIYIYINSALPGLIYEVRF